MTDFVLVPGAWLGGWAWKDVVPALAEKGHRGHPVTLTGMGDRAHLLTKDVGMETAINDVLNVIKYQELDDLVLVGHSFAGKVAAAVADRVHERVKSVLYLDAARPEWVREPQGGFDPTKEFKSITPDGLAVPLTDEVMNAIGKDIVGKQREWFMSMSTPWPVKLAKDPITLSAAYDGMKESYIFCTLAGDPVDEIVAGKWGALHGPHKLMETAHWPMTTKPKELVDDMIELAG